MFYAENAEIKPIKGGHILEGMVGTLSPSYNFNPLFATGIEQDVSGLLFSGLMKYDPKTGEIVGDMATHTLSEDKKVYEFTLKENVRWHDGQPVIANDIVFTFRDVIQNEAFPVALLKNTFKDVLIEKVDERTVRFTIPEKRKTFFTNFTLGILPRHQLVGTPVEDIMYVPFNQNPVGSGPYRLEEVFQDPDGTSVRFSAFPEYFKGEPKVESITFSIYPTIDQLMKNVSRLDAVRPMQTRRTKSLPNTSRFTEIEFITPRYLAVFFNLKDETLTTKKVRQAMRAAVDTNALAEEFYGERVDTPLVELWPQNDIVNVSKERAGELLRESGYLFDEEREQEEEENKEEAEEESDSEEIPAEEKPDSEEDISQEEVFEAELPTETVAEEEDSPEEVAEETVVEETPTEEEVFEGAQSARYIYEPTRDKVSTTTSTNFYIVGSFPEGTRGVSVNNYRLKLFAPESGRFSYHASTELKTLTYGENTYVIKFLGSSGQILDTETITITLSSPSAFRNILFPTVHAEEAGEGDLAEEGISEEAEEELPDEVSVEFLLESDEKSSPYRTNEEGEHIHLSLTYLKTFEYLGQIAKEMQEDWLEVGIEITLLSVGPEELRSAITTNNYELLLLPEYLGYNLDPYPYFHLSQAEEGGFNVSQWKNLKASLLLEDIRSTHNSEERFDSLSQLRDIMIDDVPAIFLFTPKYSWLYDTKVKNVQVNTLADLTDRYSRAHEFYIREDRTFSQGENTEGFFSWFLRKTKETFSFSTE